jgi:hypothetical protein
MELKEICGSAGGVWYGEAHDNEFIIVPLAFHVSLLMNPHASGGQEQRWCYHNVELAKKAFEHYRETEKMCFWKKWHTADISIACGNLAFNAGVIQVAGQESHAVDWNVDELKSQYPYASFLERFM